MDIVRGTVEVCFLSWSWMAIFVCIILFIDLCVYSISSYVNGSLDETQNKDNIPGFNPSSLSIGTTESRMQENSSYTLSVIAVDTSGNSSTPYTVNVSWPSWEDSETIGCINHDTNYHTDWHSHP